MPRNMTRRAGGLLSIILLLLFPGNKTGRERRAELKKVVHTINNNKILNSFHWLLVLTILALQRTTLFLYIILWQHVHTKLGPSLTSDWNVESAASSVTLRSLVLAMHFLFRSCLCKVCSHVSEALTLAIRVLFCSCLCKVCWHVSEALTLAIRVLFCSCLCRVCWHVSEALTLAIHVLFCSCLCKVCSHVSEALTLAIHVLFCSCLCKVCSHVSEALTLAIRVLFCSCLCKVCSQVSEALTLAIRVLFCSCLCNVCWSVSVDLPLVFRTLSVFLFFSGSLHTQHRAFLFKVKAWPQPHIARFTCTVASHIGQVFLRHLRRPDSIVTNHTQ